MKFFFALITFSALFLMSCEDDTLQTFEDVYIITTQAEADMVKGIIGDAIFDIDDPEVGFRGDIIITNPDGGQSDPIIDLSLFANYKFWFGNIRIESDDITDLDFLVNLEQIRDGLIVTNCSNLVSANLPSMGLIATECIISNNPRLTSIDIGFDLDMDAFEDILIDSLSVTDNAELISWGNGLVPIRFSGSTTVTGNPNLTSLGAFREVILPVRSLELELFGTTINPDRINPGTDSLTMPRITRILASEPDNDYSWLDRARDRFAFQISTFTQFNGETFMDTVLTDAIQQFDITGEIEVLEVCDLQGTIMVTPLTITSNSVGPITTETLDDQCPE